MSRQAPDYLLIDALALDVPFEQKALIHGDARSVSIAAASIVAKVERDRLMDEWHQQYPQYGLPQPRICHRRSSGRFARSRPLPIAPAFLCSGARLPILGAVLAAQTPLPLELVEAVMG